MRHVHKLIMRFAEATIIWEIVEPQSSPKLCMQQECHGRPWGGCVSDYILR